MRSSRSTKSSAFHSEYSCKWKGGIRWPVPQKAATVWKISCETLSPLRSSVLTVYRKSNNNTRGPRGLHVGAGKGATSGVNYPANLR